VVPEGILTNKKDRSIRELLRRECVIKAVIRLSQDAFKMSEGAACTSVLYAVKKDPGDPNLTEQGDIFFARAEYIGISPSGRPIEENDLPRIKEKYAEFGTGHWEGIELRPLGDDRMSLVRSAEAASPAPWLEPEVNRTSLLYDRLCYVTREPHIMDRFSYVYFHPRYWQIFEHLTSGPVEPVELVSLCVEGYPRRGSKPAEESAEGIPILKVRNITGGGIDLDTEYAPDTEEVRQAHAPVIVRKNDILVTCTGEGTIGRADIYPYEEPSVADGHVAICRLRTGVNHEYVLEYLRSEYGQIQMLRHVSGSTGQTELLKDHFSNLLVPMPDKPAQRDIVGIMCEARAEAGRLRREAEGLRTQSAEVLAGARQRMIDTLMGRQNGA